jgi:hypothetical protein
MLPEFLNDYRLYLEIACVFPAAYKGRLFTGRTQIKTASCKHGKQDAEY